MTRVNIVTEGRSELTFVKKVLSEYLCRHSAGFIASARSVLTSSNQKTNYEYRGGLTKYVQAKRDILRWIREDRGAYVSTMFDFFRLPNDFPGYDDAMRQSEHSVSVEILEKALLEDICASCPGVNQGRFIPYIQLHEFEALLFTDIRVFKFDYLDDLRTIDRLYLETKDIPPEQINHGDETAPSKRLLRAFGYRKGDAPSEMLERLTIDAIRAKCPHFSGWIDRLLSCGD